MANEAGVRIKGTDDSAKAFNSVQSNMRNLASSAAVMEGPLGKVAGRINAMGAAIGRMNPLILSGGLALAGFITFQKSAIAEAADLEIQLFRINKQLEITGNQSGYTGGQINKLGKEIGIATLASQQGARDAASALLAFDSVINDEFTRTLKLSQDVSAVFGGEMRTNVLKIGRALSNPREGLQLLNRNLLISTKAWRENVSSMFEAGQEAQAQQIILAALEKKLGGAGVSEAGGVAGSTDSLSESWTDLKTNLAATGPFKDATDAVNELLKAINSKVNNGDSESQLSIAVEEQKRLMELIETTPRNSRNSGRLDVYEKELKLVQGTIGILSRYLNVKAAEELAIRNAAEAKRDERIAQKLLDQEFENAIEITKRHEKEIKKEFTEDARRLKQLEAAYESLWLKALPPLDQLKEAYRKDANTAVEALRARGASEQEIREQLLVLEANFQEKKAALSGDKDLEQLMSSLLTQEERMEESYERRLFMIEDKFQQEKILFATKETFITELTAQEAKRREKIEAQSTRTILNHKRSVYASAAGLLQTLGAKSKEAAILAIAINKALSIGQAIQNTAVAVTAALKYPPGVRETEIAYIKSLGAAQVGIIAASGLVEAANVGSGGGGGGGGGAVASPGSIPDVPAPLESESPREVVVNLIVNGNVVAEDLPSLVSRAMQEADENNQAVYVDQNGDRIQLITT